MGYFSGVKTARQGGGGSYWTPGDYKVRVDRVIFKESGFKGTSYIVECEILEVLRAFPAEDRGEGIKFDASRKPGEKVGHVIKLDKSEVKEAALGNINNFLTACFETMAVMSGNSTEGIEIDESAVEESYGDDQPCAGLELHVHCQGIKTAKTGKPFVTTTYGVLTGLKKAA